MIAPPISFSGSGIGRRLVLGFGGFGSFGRVGRFGSLGRFRSLGDFEGRGAGLDPVAACFPCSAVGTSALMGLALATLESYRRKAPGRSARLVD
jgi:hypothetical protein